MAAIYHLHYLTILCVPYIPAILNCFHLIHHVLPYLWIFTHAVLSKEPSTPSSITISNSLPLAQLHLNKPSIPLDSRLTRAQDCLSVV